MKAFFKLGVVLIVIILLIVCWYQYTKINAMKSDILSVVTENKKLEFLCDELLLIQGFHMQNPKKQLMDLEVVDENGEFSTIKSLNIKNKILFFIDSDMCNICIDREQNNIEKISKIINDQNIILIAKGFRKSYLFNSQYFKKYSNKYHSENHFDSLGAPIYLYVDKNGEVTYTCYTSKNNEIAFNFFLDKIKNLKI